MTKEELAEKLRQLEFLQSLDESHLQPLAEIARVVTFPAETVIFREGDPATNIFLLTCGNVSLEICAPSLGCRRIMSVSAGDLLGWSPVLESSRLTATARALSDVEALKISGTQLLALCEHDARFGYEFMRCAAHALAKRLSATRLQLLDLYGAESFAADGPKQQDALTHDTGKAK